LHAKGIDDGGSRQLTYTGPAEDGSAEVQRNGGAKRAEAAAGTTRKERREAARKQAKEGRSLRRG
jgi:preprotein translocase subunit SecA